MLTRLHELGVRANNEKCEFFSKEILYCGHVIDEKWPSQVTRHAVLKARLPKKISQLRSYIGLNYYRKSLPKLSTVLHPLNVLLQAGSKWSWMKKCEQAIQESKRLITSEEVLIHFNLSLTIRLECDASLYPIGAVLSPKLPDGSERPIPFDSRSLTAAECNYAQIDREALSLVLGGRISHSYLYGRKFRLREDHQPLFAIFNPQAGISVMAAARLQLWLLINMTLSIKWWSSMLMLIANADGYLGCRWRPWKVLIPFTLPEVFQWLSATYLSQML